MIIYIEKEEFIMKKIKMILFALILAIITVFIPSSQVKASSNKTQVKKVVNGFYKNGKKLNPKLHKYLLYSSDDVREYNSSLDSFFRRQNKKYFKYKIKSVKVCGKKAKVRVKVTYRSYKKALKLGFETALDRMIHYKKYKNDPENVDDLIYMCVKKKVKKNPPKTVTKTITLKLKKKNKKWKIVDDLTIYDAINCDYASALLES